MQFICRNKFLIDVVVIIAIVVEIVIGYIINKISDAEFNLLSKHNIILLVILVILVSILIGCKLIENHASKHIQKKRLQKAFQENGGYEAVVEEMKSCIKKHDYKTIRELKKVVDFVEK